MLLCVDAGKGIKVFRLVKGEAGPAKRERVGMISKKDFAIGAAFDSLAPDDAKELKETIDLYKQQGRLKARLAMLAFPETVKAVLDYVDGFDDPTLRRHIRAAFFEGVRVSRRTDAAKAPDKSASPFL